MDKYTVDLDKVLNDFEYSELTHNHAAQAAPPPQEPKPILKTEIVKHSITNVFHSLNEYLNSDINGTERRQSNESLKGPEKEAKLASEESLSEDSSSDEEKEEILLEIEEAESQNVEVPREKIEPEIAPEPVKSIQEEPAVICEVEVFKEEKVCEEEKICEENIEVCEEEKIEVCEERIEVSEEEKVEVSEDDKIEVCEKEKVEVCEEEKIEVSEENKIEVCEDDKIEVCDEEKIEVCKEEELEVEEIVAIQPEVPESKPIGFDDNLELNETELSQYLDDLVCEEKETVEEAPKIEPESDSTAQRPNNLTLSENTNEINLIGSPGSTPYNNVCILEVLPGDEKTPDSSSSVSPTFSDASTESVKSSVITDSDDDTDNFNTTETNALNNNEGDKRGESTNEVVGEPSVRVEADPRGAGDWLGKQAPLWIPDSEATNCLHCDIKFTVIKRRHHCRACGLVLCSKCCNVKYKLEYLDAEARVCLKCYNILNRDTNSSSGSEVSPQPGNSPSGNHPNPNNPMEYCSMVPPLQQVANVNQQPPSVMVPVGVLKRKGSGKNRVNKSVMFCDGIRPGSELTNLDNDFNYNEPKGSKKAVVNVVKKNTPSYDTTTKSFIPNEEDCLPPTVTVYKSDISYSECANSINVVEMLKNEMLTFALQRNFHVNLKIVNMDCCINKLAWCFATEGMMVVGQDEIVILLEYADNEKLVPKDVFYHLNNVYVDASRGSSITEYGLSIHPTSNFLNSKNHSGFLYIRPTFQCLQNVNCPKEPYLIGILIHRWETPWAKIFPLRLILRLGAEYRYYPSPIISTRHRESVFVEIGHTIINLLADFRNFSYTLPNIRGLTIHMEEKNTTVTIPVNRYDQVMKSLNNSSDHILAFGGNFSTKADSHLVCIQDTHGNNENAYTTHAINIHNRPRKITGASFIVFNGALKSTSGLTAKSSIVEDGLMIQIPPEQMVQIRDSLRNMKDFTIHCGCVNAASDESVNITWGESDTNFNIGVKSPVDSQNLSGVPSIRVHNGKDYVCNSGSRMMRWTEVFILQNSEESNRSQDGVDISKLSENISKATCQALVKYLDLLSSNNFYKIGIRTTLHVENVSYSAGSNGIKLPPLYMKSLDNELIPVLHRITSGGLGENAIVLELIFRILNM